MYLIINKERVLYTAIESLKVKSLKKSQKNMEYYILIKTTSGFEHHTQSTESESDADTQLNSLMEDIIKKQFVNLDLCS